MAVKMFDIIHTNITLQEQKSWSRFNAPVTSANTKTYSRLVQR